MIDIGQKIKEIIINNYTGDTLGIYNIINDEGEIPFVVIVVNSVIPLLSKDIGDLNECTFLLAIAEQKYSDLTTLNKKLIEIFQFKKYTYSNYIISDFTLNNYSEQYDDGIYMSRIIFSCRTEKI